MTKTEHRRQATNYILADLSREFWPHVGQNEERICRCEASDGHTTHCYICFGDVAECGEGCQP